MVEKIKNNILIIVLLCIALLVCVANYTPNTILSGWDTLHPEFNFGANITREIFGVFRNNQGLGAVAAHSAMADLPHILLLYLLHFFIDRDFLRYFYIFLNLILGATGMYFFLYKIVLKDKIIAFLGGLFYLLNLGTMQQFVVPFEMFTTQYASLPWLFLIATSYLYAKKHSRKLLLLFSIATILSSPMAFAPTLWYVYLFTFTSYLLLLSIPRFLKQNFTAPKRVFVLIFLTIILNLYWILPNAYYILSHGSEVSEANINKIFSPQAFLYNKEFGNIFDISMLKSFLFDWSVYTGNNNFGQLLSPWIKHLNNPVVLGIGFIFAFIAMAGIIKGALRRNKFLISFVPALFLCLLFLFNDNFPFSGIYNFLKDNVPFFKEAYRFPANKVFVIFTFIYTISFAIGLMAIRNYAKRFFFLYSFIFVILIIFYMSPSFGGNFISPHMRVKIPEMYFDMFDWFKTKPKDARIANLPIHSIFGWEFYNWYTDKPSFQGAGFTWFGLKQPLLNRDFDRWSTYNERYYKEMSYALYSQNPSLLKTTLEKYDIKYILVDKSIIAPQSNPKILFYKEMQDLLENEPYIQKVKDFDNTLIIYKVNLKNDLAEDNNVYTFANLTDNQGKLLPNLLSFSDTEVMINLPHENLSFPSFLDKESIIPVNLVVRRDKDKLNVNLLTSPIEIKGDFIITLNKKDKFVVDNLKDNSPLSLGTVYLNTDAQNSIEIYPKKPQKQIPVNIFSLKYFLKLCDNANSNASFGVNKEKEIDSFSLFALRNQVCMTIPLTSIFGEEKISSESILGLSLNYEAKTPVGFCLSHLTNGMCIDYGSKNISTSKENSNYVLEYFGLENETIENLGITFFLDATNSNLEEKATYENISLSLTAPIFAKSFEAPRNINSIKINDDKITLPFPAGQLADSKIKVSKTDQNCEDNSFINPFLENQISKDNKNHFIEYVSLEGVSCDRFSYDLSQNQAYLVLITSRNMSGLPLYLCVENKVSKHCDIYANLSSSKNFVKDAFLLPPQIKNAKGYDIIINSLGIKKTISINDLKSIQIIPFPYNFLSQIKYNTSSEKPKADLTISQSYEKGWKAYSMNVKCQMSNVKCEITKVFPFVFGKEIKNHVLVNGWANGWILDSEKLKVKSEKLIVMFWPQYLEYLGFVILIASFIWIVYVYLKKDIWKN